MRPSLPQALAACLLSFSAPAIAQQGAGLDGLYVGVYAGASLLSEQNVETDAIVAGVLANADHSIEYDPGYRIGGHVGYRLSSSLRLQLDVSYLFAEGENEIEVGVENDETDQEISILSGTVGAFLDLFPIGDAVLYVGGGVGIAQIEVENDDLLDPFGDSKQTALTAFGEVGAPIDLTSGLAIVPSLRFSWYNTKEETEDFVSVAGVTETEIASIGDTLYEAQLLLQARYSF